MFIEACEGNEVGGCNERGRYREYVRVMSNPKEQSIILRTNAYNTAKPPGNDIEIGYSENNGEREIDSGRLLDAIRNILDRHITYRLNMGFQTGNIIRETNHLRKCEIMLEQRIVTKQTDIPKKRSASVSQRAMQTGINGQRRVILPTATARQRAVARRVGIIFHPGAE
jgi:hypothetical protein